MTASARLLHRLVDEAADRWPDAPSFRFGQAALSYAELARRTDQLAGALAEHGVRRGDRVALYLNKSLESAVSIFGVMKAGAAYVPIDPGAPIDRALDVMRQCRVAAIVTHAPKQADLTAILADEELQAGVRIVIGAQKDAVAPIAALDWPELEVAEGSRRVKTLEQDLAYIIFTSGSTGAPKGIMHTHQSGLAYAEAAAALYDVKPRDCLSNHSPLHFDMSTFDYFCAPLTGACTTIIPEAYAKLPASLAQLIERDRLTHWYSVPYALIQLLERGGLDKRDFSALRWVMFGGEPFPAKHLRGLMELLPQAKFANVYGPAEVNQCAHHEVTLSDLTDGVSPPVGHVWDEAEHLIVDETDRPVSSRETGELLIRSATMMRGYWERPDLNAHAFYERDVTCDVKDRFYRTGDIVEVDAVGSMRFAGRKDRQIKIRGFRVELDEIEAALAANVAVAEAAALVVQAKGADHTPVILAAVTLREDEPAVSDSETLRIAAAQCLPSYATPQAIVILDSFPRTATGKIDRRAICEMLEPAGEPQERKDHQ
ncbi:MAG: amino acid adenylation domain-containing protein [Rhodobacteraceae bacterium]|nr:amino acid adenylation domain-containing protein [Paracoccaceae bacterium]